MYTVLSDISLNAISDMYIAHRDSSTKAHPPASTHAHRYSYIYVSGLDNQEIALRNNIGDKNKILLTASESENSTCFYGNR